MLISLLERYKYTDVWAIFNQKNQIPLTFTTDLFPYIDSVSQSFSAPVFSFPFPYIFWILEAPAVVISMNLIPISPLPQTLVPAPRLRSSVKLWTEP